MDYDTTNVNDDDELILQLDGHEANVIESTLPNHCHRTDRIGNIDGLAQRNWLGS